MSGGGQTPDCFGCLEEVFPLGPDDLRSVKPACRQCPLVQECLRDAAASPAGLEMRAERLAAASRPFGGGLTGFLKRWSELKSLHRRARGRVFKSK
ncbi:MAG: hypothetical protein V1742_02010 [Pseudomonadota bacterium]